VQAGGDAGSQREIEETISSEPPSLVTAMLSVSSVKMEPLKFVTEIAELVQMPASQVKLGPQVFPHVPQLPSSVLTSLHRLPQSS